VKPKTCLDDLALFGGAPAFGRTLHVGQPNLGRRDRLIARIDDILERRWLTNNGPYVQEFERVVAGRVGARHCVATTNGTAALELAIRALGLGGEVIVPSLTFVATAHALQWSGITPVFADVDPWDMVLCPDSVARLVTPRTTGIVGVHLFGTPCDTDGLAALAARHGLRLLYDAAHAFGCSRRGRMIGTFGDAEVFSFHATKAVHAGEGGAVVTDNDDLAAVLRSMRNFGFAGPDNVVALGTNAKMSELSAAMGLTLLESADEIFAANRRNYERYLVGLDGMRGVALRPIDVRERHNHHYVALRVRGREAGISRDALLDVLTAENVRARRYFHPGVHRMAPYRQLFPEARRHLPVTERLTEELLCLPTGRAVGAEDVSAVCEIVRFAAARGTEIEKRRGRSAPAARTA
jgi:dTDP-4-amino-4,6-dideoxygalactose transaminase